MPFFVRKVRNENKYRVYFKDANGVKGVVSLHQLDTREAAYEKMRTEIYKRVEEEKQQDLINNSDSEIEDVKSP